MVFSSTIFLFIFLPLVIAVYFILPRCLRNTWLLITSLLFYAWGEKTFVFLLLASTLMNYCFGLLVNRFKEANSARWILGVSITANLGILVFYKYKDFLLDSLNGLLHSLHRDPVHVNATHLPIGISFFTFHAISYLVDIYRGHARVQKKIANFALYEALFPQLVAGPIMRYKDLAGQIDSRRESIAEFGGGVRRFVVGLSKKILIANVLAVQVDQIFAMQPASLTPLVAWMGAIYYTLQIYFDFSGYSDMAIGLGKMFGFKFMENFNYPYISCSIQEFWRRWHISLSTWFRDYLYIPMGGNRVSHARGYFNLVTVFFLCGLWHGASWTFVVWGLLHGAFLVLERQAWMSWMGRLWQPLRHAYALLVVIIAWVFFRANSLSVAWTYLRVMLGHRFHEKVTSFTPLYLDTQTILALAIGVIASMPVIRVFGRLEEKLEQTPLVSLPLVLLRTSALSVLFVLCAMQLAESSYNPFIYFRF